MDKPNEANEANITLTKLVELVEQAVGNVDALRKENAALANELKDCRDALQMALAKVEMQASRIDSLESEAQSLRKEAHWCRWFQEKYGNSTFANYMEREYRADHPEFAQKNEGDTLAA